MVMTMVWPAPGETLEKCTVNSLGWLGASESCVNVWLMVLPPDGTEIVIVHIPDTFVPMFFTKNFTAIGVLAGIVVVATILSAAPYPTFSTATARSGKP